MNKKGNAALIVLLVILGMIVVCAIWVAGTYNSLVGKDVATETAWGKVQTAYQRRADLIPNLVETVKGARDFEKSTLVEIAAMRAQAGQIKQQVADATTPAELQAANEQTNSVLARLLVVVEAYPDLKTNQNFLALQDELAGTENRIKYERDNYNDAVNSYKTGVRSFPSNIMAGMFGFGVEKWNMFEAAAGAENAPKVGFD